ncbi:MAG: hypothetical protein OXH92_21735 [Bryobacterales bacterium]|nr:hypothetical protein [Bryobacterales bacterium]
MATRTEPAATETSGALFRARRSAGVEPDLAYRADDEVRSQAGQNVITVVNARFDELSTKIDAVNSRIDTLQRAIWPLVVLLASTVFGLLYRVFSDSG